MLTAISILFALFGALCVVLVLIGLPGTWLLLAGAVLLELSDGKLLGVSPEAVQPVTFGWWLIGGCLALAAAGEGLELAAGALGARRGGATRRGTVGAFLGGLVGVLLGTILLPVPVIGSLVGALLGTFGGALAGELSHPRHRESEDKAELKDALKPALGATVGRVLGTVGKVGVAAAVWLALTVSLFID